MAEAFRILGFKVCDFQETFLDSGEAWVRYFSEDISDAQKTECIREALSNFDICLDSPCYILWKEIMQAFPNAKCIHYERPEDEWLESMLRQLKKNRSVGIGNLPDWCLSTFFLC